MLGPPHHISFTFIPDFASMTRGDSATDGLPARRASVAPPGSILRDLPDFPAPKPITESQHNPKEPKTKPEELRGNEWSWKLEAFLPKLKK